MKKLAIATAFLIPSAFAAPPCDESKNFFQVGQTCYAFPVWDFTLHDTSSRIDFAAFGEGTAGGGPAPDAGPSPDAGPAADAGPSPDSAGDSGDSDGGDSGDSGDAGEGGPGCDS